MPGCPRRAGSATERRRQKVGKGLFTCKRSCPRRQNILSKAPHGQRRQLREEPLPPAAVASFSGSALKSWKPGAGGKHGPQPQVFTSEAEAQNPGWCQVSEPAYKRTGAWRRYAGSPQGGALESPAALLPAVYGGKIWCLWLGSVPPARRCAPGCCGLGLGPD